MGHIQFRFNPLFTSSRSLLRIPNRFFITHPFPHLPFPPPSQSHRLKTESPDTPHTPTSSNKSYNMMLRLRPPDCTRAVPGLPYTCPGLGMDMDSLPEVAVLGLAGCCLDYCIVSSLAVVVVEFGTGCWC